MLFVEIANTRKNFYYFRLDRECKEKKNFALRTDKVGKIKKKIYTILIRRFFFFLFFFNIQYDLHFA